MTTIVERVGALSVGRIEAVTAAELRISLFNEAPQATALNTGVPLGFPRINAYLLIPNETGAVVAVVQEISIIRSRPVVVGRGNEGLVDLPFPTRSIIAIPLGTLLREGQDADGQPLCEFERGVPVLPSVGDPVLLPTAAQLRSIVEAKPDDRLVDVGTAPFAANAHVWVHPDKLFGRHLAILGNTGSGKSCSVAGIVRWSLEAAAERISDGAGDRPPNARFIILDPNGEYAEAFKDRSSPIRHYSVGGEGGKKPLVVPGWLWNGQEWAAFTSAQPQVQRPLLFKALRLARNAASSVLTARAHMVRRYHNYLRQVEQLCPDLPQSVAGNYRGREFGSLLEGLLGLSRTDEAKILKYGQDTADLVAAIVAIRTPIEEVRASRHWSSQNSSGYNSFQPNDVFRVLEELHTITDVFPIGTTHGEIGEDEPVRFDVMMLTERIRDVAMATGGQALSNVEPLIDRIQIFAWECQASPNRRYGRC
jgi:uncharacterized protein